MAKSKYKPRSFPLKVEKLARDGFSDKEIFQQLGISKDTFYTYVKKYPAFSDAIERGRVPVTIKVENAYLSRCIGYEYEEVSRIASVDADGNPLKKEIKKTVKKVLPHVGACKHWLRTKDPSHWKEPKEDMDTDGFHSFADLMLAYADHEKEKK